MEETSKNVPPPLGSPSHREPLLLKRRIPLLLVIAILLLVVIVVVTGFLAVLFTAAMYFRTSAPHNVIMVTPTPFQNATPGAITPTTTKIVFNEDLFVVPFPEGWNKVSDKTWEDNYEDRNIKYENRNGDFFEVVIDPAGRGVSSDEIWNYTYDKVNNKLVLSEINSPCGNAESPFCEEGDNKLNIYIPVHDANSQIRIKNHTYIFFAGNSKQEKGNDISIYRGIVEGIRFK